MNNKIAITKQKQNPPKNKTLVKYSKIIIFFPIDCKGEELSYIYM